MSSNEVPSVNAAITQPMASNNVPSADAAAAQPTNLNQGGSVTAAAPSAGVAAPSAGAAIPQPTNSNQVGPVNAGVAQAQAGSTASLVALLARLPANIYAKIQTYVFGDNGEWYVAITNNADLEAFPTLQPLVPAHLGNLHLTMKLTVDTGHPARSLGGLRLPQLPAAVRQVELKLLSGWWHWDDFSNLFQGPVRPPLLMMVQNCHLRFYGDMGSITGFGAHVKVFHHPYLESLTIENRPGRVEDWAPLDIPFSWWRGRTSLKTLAASGIDVRALAPAFAYPQALEKLRLVFTSKSTNSFVKEYMQHSTAEVLEANLRPLFASLRELDFHHHWLTEFAWGRFFQQLQHLRVHQDHIFPTYRVCTAPLRTLLPATLDTLTVHGCDFAPGPTSVSAVERSLLHVVERSLLHVVEQLAVDKSHGLRKITLVLAGRSSWVSEELVRRCKQTMRVLQWRATKTIMLIRRRRRRRRNALPAPETTEQPAVAAAAATSAASE